MLKEKLEEGKTEDNDELCRLTTRKRDWEGCAIPCWLDAKHNIETRYLVGRQEMAWIYVRSYKHIFLWPPEYSVPFTWTLWHTCMIIIFLLIILWLVDVACFICSFLPSMFISVRFLRRFNLPPKCKHRQQHWVLIDWFVSKFFLSLFPRNISLVKSSLMLLFVLIL